MGKFGDWLQKRKSGGKERYSSSIPPANSFAVGDSYLTELWDERKKERDRVGVRRGSTDGLLAVSNAFHNSGGGRAKSGKLKPPSPTIFRSSATSKAMILHAVSVQVRQQSHAMGSKLRTSPKSPTDPISKLSPDLIFYLMDFLDYMSIFQLKLTNKKLYNTISLQHLAPTIGDDYSLCALCQTPQLNTSKKCAWNCAKCGICTDRDNVSTTACRSCVPGVVEFKVSRKPTKSSIDNAKASQALHLKRKQRENEAGSQDVMICGSCADYLFQVPGISSKDICCCGQASLSVAGQSTGWLASNGKSSKRPTSGSKANEDPRDGTSEKATTDDGKTSAKRGRAYKDGYATYVEKIIEFQSNSSDASSLAQLELASQGTSDASTLVQLEPTNAKKCHKCSGYQDIIPNMKVAEICLCGTPGATTDQDYPHPTDQGSPRTVKATRKRVSIFAGLPFQKASTTSQRKTCPTCSHVLKYVPGITSPSEVCACPRDLLSASQESTVPTIVAPRYSHSKQKDSMSPRERKTCPVCSHFSEFTAGITMVSEMCRCPDGPLPIDPKLSTLLANSLERTPSSQKDVAKRARKSCVVCHRFSEVTPGITLASRMCQCPNGPLTIKPPVKSPVELAIPYESIPPTFSHINLPVCKSCRRYITTNPIRHHIAGWCRCVQPPIPPTPAVISPSPISKQSQISMCPSCKLQLRSRAPTMPMGGWCQCPTRSNASIPAATASSTTNVARETCRTCHRFSGITPGVTLMEKMCHCADGPLVIKRPWNTSLLASLVNKNPGLLSNTTRHRGST